MNHPSPRDGSTALGKHGCDYGRKGGHSRADQSTDQRDGTETSGIAPEEMVGISKQS